MVSELSASSRFFVLQKGSLWSRFDVDAGKVEPVNREEGADCPKCGEPIGMMRWLPPYRVELVLHGEESGDYLETSGDDLLVSERFAKAFREDALMGLEGFHPVEVVRVRRKRRGPKPTDIPRYLAVSACFGRAAVDVTRSRIRYNKPPTCDECRSEGVDSIHGFTLEPGSWQGEDIFRPRGLFGDVVVSERFARFVERHGFTNMRLTPTEEFVWDPLARGPPDPKPTSA
ncbi:hypothetical protein [Archangium lansingense]|uniref:Uncharacterized protein n=1 Tax=Archangium lansingense TaxID=2995310 RepID=A0ABT4AIN3_9BACT|nr:hypothetical protein [Archangium lansinium]MCY1081171.1 hypothetical protein [Archangium lansinium]